MTFLFSASHDARVTAQKMAPLHGGASRCGGSDVPHAASEGDSASSAKQHHYDQLLVCTYNDIMKEARASAAPLPGVVLKNKTIVVVMVLRLNFEEFM